MGQEPMSLEAPVGGTDDSASLGDFIEDEPADRPDEQVVRRLRDAGVQVEAVRYDGQVHGFVGMAAMVDDGKHALDLAGAALRAALA